MFTEEELKILLLKVSLKTDDAEDIKESLILHYRGLLNDLINKYDGEKEDLLSIATIGLIKAINTYEYSKGSVKEYIEPCVKKELDKSYKSAIIEENVIQDYKTPDLLDSYLKKEFSNDELKKVIDSLPLRDQDIIKSLYGLYGFEKKSKEEISEKYSISIEELNDIIKYIYLVMKRQLNEYENPTLDEYKKEIKDRRFQIISISINPIVKKLYISEEFSEKDVAIISLLLGYIDGRPRKKEFTIGLLDVSEYDIQKAYKKYIDYQYRDFDKALKEKLESIKSTR